MTKTPKRPRDVNQLAKLMVDIASGDCSDPQPPPKNEAAAAMGRKGGAARAASMTAEQRSDIARKAATSRWTKDA